MKKAKNSVLGPKNTLPIAHKSGGVGNLQVPNYEYVDISSDQHPGFLPLKSYVVDPLHVMALL